MKHFSLGDLIDPAKYTDPIELSGFSYNKLEDYLKQMLIIRIAEDKISENVENGIIKCPCHLAIGQEAIAVGISQHLRNSDRVFGGHRSHPHYLALGGDVYKLFSEVLGRETGCSRGMGGSMHLFARNCGFFGSVPIVAGTIPISVGAALAAKMDGKGDIAVCYFGDGASEEGVLHESLNLASYLKLPVIFVCENNLFSSHLHIDLRQPDNSIARFAEAHRIDYQIIDGNDVVTVSKTAEKIIKKTRENKTPFFLETVTYRWKGHVGHREDIDVGLKRNKDLIKWKHRDPIKRLKIALINDGYLTEENFQNIEANISDNINKSWNEAMKSPFPEKSNLLDMVFYQNIEN